MRRLLLGFSLAILLVAPPILTVRAGILPNCEQTIYLVGQVSDGGASCLPSARANCRQFTPEQYDKQFPTQQDKEANPPLFITTTGQCGFNDFVQLFINLANWGLGVLAALALLFTIWGGFTLVISHGNADQVREGKATIWGGVLGAIIVLTAWIVIGAVVSAFSESGPVLFAGTRYARTFSGRSPCPSNYKACVTTALKLNCRDDRKNNDAVSKSQTILADLGCYLIDIDGCFGPKTDAGVRLFQKKNAGLDLTVGTQTYHMPSSEDPGYADGTIGPITWAFLNAAAAGNTAVHSCRSG